jgi:hypothetical protein
MKKLYVLFTPEFLPSPVSFWAHQHIGSDVWRGATSYEPPLPNPIPGKGWARIEVELDGVILEFASAHEIAHVIDVLSKNPLPSTRRLSEERGTSHGPNSHWLSRLPAKAKSQKFRQRLVKFLKKAQIELARAA